MVCLSLVELCLGYVANNIERWTAHVTEFHVKESKYLITDMSRLPQDLVNRLIQQLIIVKKLSLQSLVLFLDDQLQRIELPPNLTLATDLFLKVIARLSRNLVSLKLGSGTKLQNVDGLALFTRLHHLHILNCSKATRLDDSLSLVFQQNQLVSLNLQNTSASDKSLSFLSSHCTSLEDLNLSQSSVSSSCVSSILSNCTKLKKLHLEGCFYVGNEAFDGLSMETNTELQELNLAMCDINDSSLSKIVTRFVDLKALFLQGCNITDIGLRDIASTLCKLNVLRLNNISAITDRGIIAMAKKKIPTLMMDLSGHIISDRGLEVIAQNLPVVLEDCVNISDRGLVALASNCPNIKVLNLNRCTGITDNGVLPIVNSCTKLQRLFLDSLPITRLSLSSLSKSSSLLQVSLSSCGQIKMGSELTALCKRVKIINLSKCAKVSLQDYQKLQSQAPRSQITWN